MELKCVAMEIPEGANLILGHTHFIKTVEDLYEAVVNTVPGAKFAIAFNEASGPCLMRVEANDDELRNAAIANAQAIGAGHLFVVLLRQAYPINVLGRIKECFEVCSIYGQSGGGDHRGKPSRPRVLGVIDGASPKGVEGPSDVARRKEFLRKIGYKL